MTLAPPSAPGTSLDALAALPPPEDDLLGFLAGKVLGQFDPFHDPAGRLLLRFGYHFSSLAAIVFFLVLGYTPFRAVVYATVLAFLLSFLERRSWMTPRKIWSALAQGATGALSVIPVMAVAGIIVGVMTLTGLALRLAGIIVDFSNGNVVLTALFSAAVVVLLVAGGLWLKKTVAIRF